jgi:Holliday junction resolvasome RuvABC ATP-dependent DNA helicase subunit
MIIVVFLIIYAVIFIMALLCRGTINLFSNKDKNEHFSEYGEPILEKEIETLEGQKEPLKVEIKNAQLDASKIVEYKGEEVKKFEFRPQTWEQFIGQKEGKEKAKTIIKKAKRGIRSHFLVDGIKGHGKTTFVELLAKSLNAKLIERVGKQIDEDGLLNIINEINTSIEKYIVFFIDEMETMDWKVIKILNPIIEQFKVSNKKIKPFLFAGATINKHILITNNPDTLDRIPPSHHIKFARYTSEDVKKIIKQYREQLYPNENVNDKILKIISENAKFNPRTSIALLEDYIVEQDIAKVLKNGKIVKDGLNEIDIEILKILSKSKRAMGANALAMRVKLSQKEYMTEFEPFLVEYGYINRIPSRVITEKGKKLLEDLK